MLTRPPTSPCFCLRSARASPARHLPGDHVSSPGCVARCLWCPCRPVRVPCCCARACAKGLHAAAVGQTSVGMQAHPPPRFCSHPCFPLRHLRSAATDGSPQLTVDYFNANQARSVAAIESSITGIPSDWIDVNGSPPGSAGRRLLQAGQVLVDTRLFGGEAQLDQAVDAFNASLASGQFDRLLRGIQLTLVPGTVSFKGGQVAPPPPPPPESSGSSTNVVAIAVPIACVVSRWKARCGKGWGGRRSARGFELSARLHRHSACRVALWSWEPPRPSSTSAARSRSRRLRSRQRWRASSALSNSTSRPACVPHLRPQLLRQHPQPTRFPLSLRIVRGAPCSSSSARLAHAPLPCRCLPLATACLVPSVSSLLMP